MHRKKIAARLLGWRLFAQIFQEQTNDLRVTQMDVPIADWPLPVPALRVGQLSDMHCNGPQAIERIRRAVDLLMAQKPDVVFLTGDYISYQPQRWSRPAAKALTGLTSVAGGVFAVLGNHDYVSHGAETVSRELREVGIRVLRNASTPLPQAPGVWVVGLESRRVGRQDIHAALTGIPSEACRLLLVHEPDYADEAPPGFALQFSGHSHAGQIRLPGMRPLYCPENGRKYPEGLQQARHHRVYTSRGVGVGGPQFRLFCPPEVTVLNLLRTESSSA